MALPPMRPEKPQWKPPRRGSEEERQFLAEVAAKIAARDAEKVGEAPTNVAVKRESDYPCPTVRVPSCMADRDWLPIRQRNPDDVGEWKRRVWKVDKLDFEGNIEDRKLFNKMHGQLMLNGEVNTKLRLVLNQVGIDLFHKENCIPLSAMLDVLIRWFVQHPPSKDWVLAYIGEWWANHRRGPSTAVDSYSDANAWSQTGEFSSPQDYEEFMTKRKMDLKRRKREVMESGDLKFEDITMIEKDFLRNGRLELPKIPKPEG